MSTPQHSHSALTETTVGPVGARYICPLNGYLPLGFFQLWNAQTQKPYPYSLGTAAHDDILFAALWPRQARHHLASVICYQISARQPVWGENWEFRRAPRIDGKEN